VTDRSNWQAAVARTVEAMGYDTVDVERSTGGLLRVTIDRVPGRVYATGGGSEAGPSVLGVTIEDCEAVTHQLQYALEVDHVAYERLEVSSPGLDRPLRKETDVARFVGEAAEVTLKAPLAGRRKFRGLLAARDGGWRLLLDDKVGTQLDSRDRVRKGSTTRAQAPIASSDTVQTLDFEWHEVRDARLVPVVDFKGRARSARDETDGGGGLQR
jgi:ribosome maturation factor RimP